MAKKSKIAQNEKRKTTVERYAARRAELKEIIRRPATPAAERAAAVDELRRQPRDASATRVRNRDSVDGRPRGYLRTFGLSRVRMREQVHAGFLPGVTKSSWWHRPERTKGGWWRGDRAAPPPAPFSGVRVQLSGRSRPRSYAFTSRCGTWYTTPSTVTGTSWGVVAFHWARRCRVLLRDIFRFGTAMGLSWGWWGPVGDADRIWK